MAISDELTIASDQFELYMMSMAARSHQGLGSRSLSVFDLKCFGKITFLGSFYSGFGLMTFSYFFKRLKNRLFAVKMLKNYENYHVPWSLMVIGGMQGVIIGSITNLIAVFIFKWNNFSQTLVLFWSHTFYCPKLRIRDLRFLSK